MFTSARTRIALQNAFYKGKSTPILTFKVIAAFSNYHCIYILLQDIFGTYTRVIEEAAAINVSYNHLRWAKLRNFIGVITTYEGGS